MIYGDWVGRWAAASPDKEALVDAIEGKRYTYGMLAGGINRMARFLRDELGITKGDRVACLSFNRSEYIVLFFALSRLGAILVPLNFRLAGSEFLYFMEDSLPSAMFFDREHREVVETLKGRVGFSNFVCLDNDDTVGISLPSLRGSLSPEPFPEAAIGPEDPQLIIYTSGTTGLPKGVILTHGMITWNAFNTNIGWDLRSDDRTILHAAMFYTAGWNVFTLPLFQCRGVNILVRSFDPDLILELMEKEKVTVFFGVPTMYQMLMDSPRFPSADFSRMRFAVSGGAPLSPAIYHAFREKKSLKIREGYGLTEVGPNNFMADGKPGTLGHPMPYVDVRLNGPDGREVPAGEEGEILLRGPNVCAGYWNKPETTSEAIVEGWFHTGDLGKVDGDGHFFIAGRLKDMIISGGVNIYPAEIEKAVELHPAVEAAAVIGVPDPKWGEVGKAIVELEPGTSLNLHELTAFLGERLGKFKLPKYLAVVENLPRTAASGKVQKYVLKEKYGQPENG